MDCSRLMTEHPDVSDSADHGKHSFGEPGAVRFPPRNLVVSLSSGFLFTALVL